MLALRRVFNVPIFYICTRSKKNDLGIPVSKIHYIVKALSISLFISVNFEMNCVCLLNISYLE